MRYIGNTDGAASGKRPGTEVFVELMVKHFGFSNLGTWAVRNMRSSDPNAKPRLSVHATARACDLGFKWDDAAVRSKVAQVIDWLVANYEALGIQEVHDYSGVSKKGTEEWGRGWRCDRGGGKPGWKDWTPTDNGGTPKSRWIHVELDPSVALTRNAMKKAWQAVPKP